MYSFQKREEKKYDNANKRTLKTCTHIVAIISVCYSTKKKKYQKPFETVRQQLSATLIKCSEKSTKRKKNRQSAMQTRLRRVSWKLIINLYCHSNIIVNLNRRHIFNATYQINVKRPNAVRFFSFCFRNHSLFGRSRTPVCIECSDRQNLYNVNEDQRMIFRSTNYFIYFIHLVDHLRLFVSIWISIFSTSCRLILFFLTHGLNFWSLDRSNWNN